MHQFLNLRIQQSKRLCQSAAILFGSIATMSPSQKCSKPSQKAIQRSSLAGFYRQKNSPTTLCVAKRTKNQILSDGHFGLAVGDKVGLRGHVVAHVEQLLLRAVRVFLLGVGVPVSGVPPIPALQHVWVGSGRTADVAAGGGGGGGTVVGSEGGAGAVGLGAPALVSGRGGRAGGGGAFEGAVGVTGFWFLHVHRLHGEVALGGPLQQVPIGVMALVALLRLKG